MRLQRRNAIYNHFGELPVTSNGRRTAKFCCLLNFIFLIWYGLYPMEGTTGKIISEFDGWESRHYIKNNERYVEFIDCKSYEVMSEMKGLVIVNEGHVKGNPKIGDTIIFNSEDNYRFPIWCYIWMTMSAIGFALLALSVSGPYEKEKQAYYRSWLNMKYNPNFVWLPYKWDYASDGKSYMSVTHSQKGGKPL